MHSIPSPTREGYAFVKRYTDAACTAAFVSGTAPPDPARIGYTFNGWRLGRDATIVFDFSTAIIYDMTWYATWLSPSQASLGDSVFPRCPNLETLRIEATAPPAVGSGTLDGSPNCAISVPRQASPLMKAR